MTLLRTPAHPPLKWAGGKRWLVPLLAGRLPKYQRLVEPCMGAMSVTLGLTPQRALVNDVNPHLVNFYRQIQQGLQFNLPYGHSEADYYAARERFNSQIQAGETATPEMAQLFYYLNRTGFNGLCRFNKSGLFNVPFGRYARIQYRQNFDDITAALQGVDIHQGDFAGLTYAEGDFIYMDPPYDAPFTTYSQGGFGWEEQVRLAEFYAALGLPVAISNQATARILELYTGLGYRVETLNAPRRISSSGNRDDVLEVLAWHHLP